MGKQFHVYLLPDDVETLVNTLKSQLDVSLIQPFSNDPHPIDMQSAISQQGGSVRVNCYMIQKGADIKMKFIPSQARWDVQPDSEVIEFRGASSMETFWCVDVFTCKVTFSWEICSHLNEEFLTWAEKVFRLAKKSLHRSKSLNVYVGERAEEWKRKGGRFAWMVTAARGPLYEAETEEAQKS